MNISKTIFQQETLGDQQRRVYSKQHALSLSKGPFSEAAAIFAHGAYWHDVSTEKWRERR